MKGDISSTAIIPGLILSINSKLNSCLVMMKKRGEIKPLELKFTEEESTLICNSHLLADYTEGLSDLLLNIKKYDLQGKEDDSKCIDKKTFLKGDNLSFEGHILLPGLSTNDKFSYTKLKNDNTLFSTQKQYRFNFGDILTKKYTHFPMLFDLEKMAKRENEDIIDYAYNLQAVKQESYKSRGVKNYSEILNNDYTPNYNKRFGNIVYYNKNKGYGKDTLHIQRKIINKLNNHVWPWRWSKPKENNSYYIYLDSRGYNMYDGDNFISENIDIRRMELRKTFKHTFVDFRKIKVEMKFTDKKFVIPGVVDEVRSIESISINHISEGDFSTEDINLQEKSSHTMWREPIPIEGIEGRFSKQIYQLKLKYYDLGSLGPFTQSIHFSRLADVPLDPTKDNMVNYIKPAISSNYKEASAGHFQKILDNATEKNKYGSAIFMILRARYDRFVLGKFNSTCGSQIRVSSDDEFQEMYNVKHLLDHLNDRTLDKKDYLSILAPEFSDTGRMFTLKLVKTLIRKYIVSYQLSGLEAGMNQSYQTMEDALKSDVLNITLLHLFLTMMKPMHSDNYFFFYKKVTDGMDEQDIIRLDAQRNEKSVIVAKKFRRNADDVINMSNMDKFTILTQMMSKLYDAKSVMEKGNLTYFDSCLPIKKIFNSISFDERIGKALKHDNEDTGVIEKSVSFKDFDIIESNIKKVMEDIKDSLNPKTIVLSTIQDKLSLPNNIKEKLDTELGKLQINDDSQVNSDSLKGRLKFLQIPNRDNVSNLNLAEKCSILTVLQDIESNVKTDDDINEIDKKSIISAMQSNYYSILKDSLVQQEGIKVEEDDSTASLEKLVNTTEYMNGIIRLFKTKKSNQAKDIFLYQYGTIKKELLGSENMKKDITDRIAELKDLNVLSKQHEYSQIDSELSNEYVKLKKIHIKASSVKTGLFAAGATGLAASVLVNKLIK